MAVLDREYDDTMALEEGATEPLAGGMMHGYQCGMLWGSSLAAGARAHQLIGPGTQAEVAAVRGRGRRCGGALAAQLFAEGLAAAAAVAAE